MRAIPWFVPLLLLAVAPAWGQRTMTIVSSDPADSSIEVEAVEDFHPKSWVTISPLPMLLGYQGMQFPPYGRVVYYREMGYLTDLGAGMELSLKGTDPGIYATARFHVSRLYWWASMGGYISYRTFGEDGNLWTLGLMSWYDATIAGKVLISTGFGVDLYKGSHKHDLLLIERPKPDDGVGIVLTLELGYML